MQGLRDRIKKANARVAKETADSSGAMAGNVTSVDPADIVIGKEAGQMAGKAATAERPGRMSPANELSPESVGQAGAGLAAGIARFGGATDVSARKAKDAVIAPRDDREQEIYDRHVSSETSGRKGVRARIGSAYGKAKAQAEIGYRRQQRELAYQAPPEKIEVVREILSSLGNRRKVLGILREMTPEQRAEVLKLAPGVAQQLGDDRGSYVNRMTDALGWGIGKLGQSYAELIPDALGGTELAGSYEEIDYIRQLEGLAGQEFAPARPSDGAISSGGLQAIQMAPWMATIIGGGGLGKTAATKAAKALGRSRVGTQIGAGLAKGGLGGAGAAEVVAGAAGSAGGVTAAAWPQQYAEEVDALKEMGIEEGMGMRFLAGTTAAFTGLLESIVPNPIKVGKVPLTQGVAKAVRSHLWEALKRAPAEGAEEYLQGISSGLGEFVADQLYENTKDKTIADAFKKGWDQGNESWITLGFIMGVPGLAGAARTGARAQQAEMSSSELAARLRETYGMEDEKAQRLADKVTEGEANLLHEIAASTGKVSEDVGLQIADMDKPPGAHKWAGMALGARERFKEAPDPKTRREQWQLWQQYKEAKAAAGAEATDQEQAPPEGSGSKAYKAGQAFGGIKDNIKKTIKDPSFWGTADYLDQEQIDAHNFGEYLESNGLREGLLSEIDPKDLKQYRTEAQKLDRDGQISYLQDLINTLNQPPAAEQATPPPLSQDQAVEQPAAGQATPPPLDQDPVEALVDKIVRGETNWTPEEMQLQETESEAIEAELNKRKEAESEPVQEIEVDDIELEDPAVEVELGDTEADLAEELRKRREGTKQAETPDSGEFGDMGGSAVVDNMYDNMLDSIKKTGDVPGPEKSSNVGKAWKAVKGKASPEDFVSALQSRQPSKPQDWVDLVSELSQPKTTKAPTQDGDINTDVYSAEQREAIDDYDTVTGLAQDIVDDPDAWPEHAVQAAEKYMAEVEEDYEKWGGRGDVEGYESAFLDALESPTTKKSRSQPAKKEGYYAPDTGSRNDADPSPLGDRAGWKLHVTVDPSNYDKATEMLRDLGLYFKQGAGGDHKNGKDYTIYTGSKAKMERIAKEVSDVLGDLAMDPQGEALTTDMQIHGKVWGRFDTDREGFNQYGKPDVPYLSEDVKNHLMTWGQEPPKEMPQERIEATRKILADLYGEFYTGKKKPNPKRGDRAPKTATTPALTAQEKQKTKERVQALYPDVAVGDFIEPKTKEHQDAKSLGEQFGIEVLFADMGERLGGFTDADAGGKRFFIVNSNKKLAGKPLWAVVGHELAHATAVDDMFKLVGKESLQQAAAQYASLYKKSDPYHKRLFDKDGKPTRLYWQEGMATLIGKFMSDKSYRDALQGKSPSTWRKIVDAVLEFFGTGTSLTDPDAKAVLAELRGKLKGQSTAKEPVTKQPSGPTIYKDGKVYSYDTKVKPWKRKDTYKEVKSDVGVPVATTGQFGEVKPDLLKHRQEFARQLVEGAVFTLSGYKGQVQKIIDGEIHNQNHFPWTGVVGDRILGNSPTELANYLELKDKFEFYSSPAADPKKGEPAKSDAAPKKPVKQTEWQTRFKKVRDLENQAMPLETKAETAEEGYELQRQAGEILKGIDADLKKALKEGMENPPMGVGMDMMLADIRGDVEQGADPVEAAEKRQKEIGDKFAAKTPTKSNEDVDELDKAADKAVDAALEARQKKSKIGAPKPKRKTTPKIGAPKKKKSAVKMQTAHDKAKALMDKLRGDKLMSGVDPKLMAEVVDVALNYIDAGVETFKEYVEAMLEFFTEADVRKFGPYMESGWRSLYKKGVVADPAGKVADVINDRVDEELENARRMKPDGTPEDGEPIIEGDIFLTSTGRMTTPYPKVSFAKSQAAASEKRIAKWLLKNAMAEAKDNNDEHNAQLFKGDLSGAQNGVKIPTASLESANEYLFGEKDYDTTIEGGQADDTGAMEKAREERFGVAGEIKVPMGVSKPSMVDHGGESGSGSFRKSQPEISIDEAKERIEEWKKEAKKIGETEDHSNKVIFSLFDYTGTWSQPWRDAGYTVIQYDIKKGDDIMSYFPTGDIINAHEKGFEVWGVLAACPCTTMTGTGNRWWAERHDVPNEPELVRIFGKDALKRYDTPHEYNKDLVMATRAFIEMSAPQFYAVENPYRHSDKPITDDKTLKFTGRIGKYIGEEDVDFTYPTMTFQPHNYGDPYTKETGLWGDFDTELPTANVEPTEGSMVHKKSGGDPTRSDTPEGFAYAFFQANHDWRSQSDARRDAYEKDRAELIESIPEGFPKPNKHGAYSDEQVETIDFNSSKSSARIRVLEALPNHWLSGYDSQHSSSGSSNGVNIGDGSSYFHSRQEAIEDAANRIIKYNTPRYEGQFHSKTHENEAKKQVAWAKKQLDLLDKPVVEKPKLPKWYRDTIPAFPKTEKQMAEFMKNWTSPPKRGLQQELDTLEEWLPSVRQKLFEGRMGDGITHGESKVLGWLHSKWKAKEGNSDIAKRDAAVEMDTVTKEYFSPRAELHRMLEKKFGRVTDAALSKAFEQIREAEEGFLPVGERWNKYFEPAVWDKQNRQIKLVEKPKETEQATDTVSADARKLKQAGLKINKEGDEWVVSGKTYPNRVALGTVKRDIGGRYDGETKTWRYKTDPTNAIADQLSDRGDGTGSEEGASGDADVERNRVREREAARPNERGSSESVLELVGDDTKNLIERGLKFGIPAEVLEGQIEDIGRVTQAFEKDRPMFLIGSAPGMGKSFVLGGSIAEIRKRQKAKGVTPRFIYVTENQELIRQLKKDLADYGVDDVEFVTYAGVRNKRPNTSGAVVLIDEAHNAKNLQTKNGKGIQAMVGDSDFTVYATATPFENVAEAKYLEASGVFDGVEARVMRTAWNNETKRKETYPVTIEGFDAWAYAYGADLYWPKMAHRPRVYWHKHMTVEAGQIQANEWLAARGVYTQRPMVLPADMVRSDLRAVTADKKYVKMFSDVLGAYAQAEENAADNTEAGQIKMHGINLQKRMLEAAKVKEAIKRTNELVEGGKQVIIFVNTKSDRRIGRYANSEKYRQKNKISSIDPPTFQYPEIARANDLWQRDFNAAKSMGSDMKSWVRQRPRPFAVMIERIAEATYNAGIDFTLPSVIDDLMGSFGDQAVDYTGARKGLTDKQAKLNLDSWKGGEVPIIIATMDKGGTGLSYHDTTGKMPERVQVNINLPWSGTQVEQVSGRLARLGTAKPVALEWIFADNIPFERELSKTVGSRMRSMKAAVQGDRSDQAQQIKDFDFAVKPPKKLFRGTGDGKGTGLYAYGRGLYSTANKDYLKQYKFNQFEELTPEEAFPRNPLHLNQAGEFIDWLLKESGETRLSRFNEKWKDPSDFVKSKGFDGVTIGDKSSPDIVVWYDAGIGAAESAVEKDFEYGDAPGSPRVGIQRSVMHPPDHPNQLASEVPAKYFSGTSTNETRADDTTGLLISPETPQLVKQVDNYDQIIIDNGVWTEFSSGKPFSPERFNELLDDVEPHKDKVRFVVAPDRVGDWEGTLERSVDDGWLDQIRERGFKVAFAAQDGIENNMDRIPWDQFDVLFIGGTTAWKLGYFPHVPDGIPSDADLKRIISPSQRQLDLQGENDAFFDMIREAKRRGKPIHAGRVNSKKRLARTDEYGAVTVDGNMLAKGPKINYEKLRQWYEELFFKSLSFDIAPKSGKRIAFDHNREMWINPKTGKEVDPETGKQVTKPKEGKDYFSDDAIKKAEEDSGYKSREKLIYLTPDEFLTLAETFPDGSSHDSIFTGEDKRKTVGDLLDKGTKLSSVLELVFEADEKGTAQVVGHEGRHRATALKALGVTSIPVMLKSQGSNQIRWSEQADTSNSDRIIGEWPRVLKGETSGQIPFPVADPSKKSKLTETKDEEQTEAEGPGQVDRPPLSEVGKVGNTASLILANGEELEVQYVFVEAEALIPSHDARRNFAKNEDGDDNERPYHDPKQGRASRETVASIAKAPNAKLLTTDTPTPIDGPPMATPDGVVLGGNARTMGIQLGYQDGEVATQLKQMMVDAAEKFGVSPSDVEKMNQPVVVRVLSKVGERGELSAILNESMTAAKSQAVEAVSRGKRISEQTTTMIGGLIKDGSLRNTMAHGKSADRIVEALVKDGAWTQKDVDQFVDPNTYDLNEDGKTAIEQMLLGRIIGDPSIAGDAAKSNSQKLLAGVGPIVKLISDAKHGKRFHEVVKTAVEAYPEYKNSDAILEDYFLNQGSIVPFAGQGDRSVMLMVDAFDKLGPKKFKGAMTEIAQSLDIDAGSQASMFGAATGEIQTVDEAIEFQFVPPPKDSPGADALFQSLFQTEEGKNLADKIEQPLKAATETIDELADRLKAENPEITKLWVSETDSEIKLAHIEVKKESRGKGIGGKVLEALKARAIDRGVPIVLTAQAESGKKTALERFYKKHGFKKPGNRRDFSLSRHTHVLYQAAPDDVQAKARTQSIDIAFAAEQAGITTFDELVTFAVKKYGERRTREIGAYLQLAGKVAEMRGVRPTKDVLGMGGVTREQLASVAQEAFPMYSDEQIEANMSIIDAVGIDRDMLGFTPFGSPVPGTGLLQSQKNKQLEGLEEAEQAYKESQWEKKRQQETIALRQADKPVREQIKKFKGTPFAKVAQNDLAYQRQIAILMDKLSELDTPAERKAFIDEHAGRLPLIAKPKVGKDNSKSLREALVRDPIEGGWKYLEDRAGGIGPLTLNKKADLSVNSGMKNCNPSEGCAVHCYIVQARSNLKQPASQAKSGLMDMLARRDPIRMARMITNAYMQTDSYEKGLMLRFFDKGDFDGETAEESAWFKVVDEVNRLGLPVQIFSKKPQILERLDDRNVRLLSIDSTMMYEKDPKTEKLTVLKPKSKWHPALKWALNKKSKVSLAVTYQGIDYGQDLKINERKFMEMVAPTLLEQKGVILPVVLGRRKLSFEELGIAQLPKGLKAHFCEVASGYGRNTPKGSRQSLGEGVDMGPHEMQCTTCNLNAKGMGCFFKQAAHAKFQSMQKEAGIKPTAIPMLDQINELRKRIEANGEISEKEKAKALRAATTIERLLVQTKSGDANESSTSDGSGRSSKSQGQRVDERGGENLKGPGGVDTLHQATERWHKKSRAIIEQKMGKKASPQEVLNMLKKSGVKQEELDWSGLPELLGDQKSVTKEEVLEAIDTGFNVEETVLRGTGQQQYAVSDAMTGQMSEERFDSREQAQEFINDNAATSGDSMGDAVDIDEAAGFDVVEVDDDASGTKYGKSDYVLPGGTDQVEIAIRSPNIKMYVNEDPSHFGDVTGKRGIVWFRGNTRIDADGKKVFFLEEVQSKRHQAGRKAGYRSKALTIAIDKLKSEREALGKQRDTALAAIEDWESRIHIGSSSADLDAAEKAEEKYQRLDDEWHNLTSKLHKLEMEAAGSVPDAPFKKTWPMLAMKRAIQYAAENGFDRIAWTTGEQQADRYDLSKKIGSIQYSWSPEGTYGLSFFGLDGVELDLGRPTYDLEIEQVEEFVGKEIAEKIANHEGTDYTGDGDSGVLEDEDLKVGGEGMKAFYDKMLPNEVNKFIKKFGARVGKTSFGSDLDVYQGDEFMVRKNRETGTYAILRRSETVPVLENLESLADAKRAMSGIYVIVDQSEEAIGDGPWLDLSEAQEFLRNEVGAPNAKVVQLGSGKPSGGFIIVDQHAYGENIGEGPWDTRDEAEEFIANMRDPEAGLAVVPLAAGWDSVETSNQSGKIGQQPSFDITPEMRESALTQGQPLFQPQQRSKGGNVKGWTQFISSTRAIIGATDRADASTLPHELFHPIRRFLLNRNVPQDKREGITDDEIMALEDYAGVAVNIDPETGERLPGVWTVPAEEKAAKAWEQYWLDGSFPAKASKALRDLFAKMARWMAKVYKGITNITVDEKPLPENIRKLFDKLVQRGKLQDQAETSEETQDDLDEGELDDEESPPESPPEGPPIQDSASDWSAEVTSTKLELKDDLREQRGLPPVTDVASQTQDEWLDVAERQIKARPLIGSQLVNQINEKPRVLNNIEVAILQIHYRQTYNELEEADNRLTEARESGDPTAQAEANTATNLVLAQLEVIEEAAKKAGREWGRSGVAQQIVLAKDFSRVGMMRLARIAQGGRELTDGSVDPNDNQREEIDKLYRRLAEAEGALEKAQQEKQDKERKLNIANAIIEELKNTGGKPVRKPAGQLKVNQIIKSFKQKFASLFKADGDTLFSTEDEDLAAAAKELVEAYVNDLQVNSVGEFLARAKKDMGGELPQKVEAALTTAWKNGQRTGDIVTPQVDRTNLRGMTRVAREILRSLVEVSGLSPNNVSEAERDALVAEVHKSMKEIVTDITYRETEDAISGYGQSSPLSKNDIDVIMRDITGQLQQVGKIADMKKGIAPARTGTPRREPSDVERELTKIVNELKRQGNFVVTDPDTQIKTARDAAKRAIRNRIYDLNKEIRHYMKTGDRLVKTHTEIEADDELIRMRKELADLKMAHKKIIPPRGMTREQQLKHAHAAMTRAIDTVVSQLKSGDVSPKKGAPPVSDELLEVRKAQLDALKALRDEMRAQLNPKLTPEEKAIKQYKRILTQQAADMLDRMATMDFEPKAKKEVRTLSQDELDMKRKVADIKAEFFQRTRDYRLANMKGLERAWDVAKEMAHFSRAAMTSFDLSGVFRQGGAAVYGHPKLALESSKEMLRALGSKAAEFDIAEAVRNDPMYQVAMSAGLQITEEEGRITKQEEAYMGRWARMVPGVAGSARAYTTFLNGIRFRLFKHMTENLGIGGKVTPEEAKVIASYVNVATGRSNLPLGMKWLEGMNMVFFAPRYVASRFQYLALPFYTLGSSKVSGRVKKKIAQEYARHLLGVASFMGLTVALFSLLTDDEDEWPYIEIDPRSSDFLKIIIGETRIDPMSGFSQVIVFMTQTNPFIAQKKSTETGEIIDLLGEDVPWGGQTIPGTIGNFLRKKLAPVPGAAINFMTVNWDSEADDYMLGKNAIGQEIPLIANPLRNSIVRDMFAPLSWQEVADTMYARGIPKGTAISAMAILGMGTGTYGPKTRYVNSTKQEREDIIKKDLKTMQWDSPDPAYSEFLTPDQAEAFRKRREYRKMGLVDTAANVPDEDRADYEQAMESHEKAIEALKSTGWTKGEARRMLLRYWPLRHKGASPFQSNNYLKPPVAARLRQINRIFAE